MTFTQKSLSLRELLVSIFTIFIISPWCSAEVTSVSYSEILKKIVFEAATADISGRPEVPGPRSRGYSHRIITDYYPIEGLDGPDAVPFLIDVMINGPDWKDEKLLATKGGIIPHIARCSAAINLGAHKDPRAFEPLLEMLKHGDFLEMKYKITYPDKNKYDIRIHAAAGLGYLRDSNAVEPLVMALQSSDNIYVRIAAAGALGYLGSPKATNPLLLVLKNKQNDNTLREVCINSLARIRDMRTLPVILETASEIGYGLGVDEYLIYMTRIKFELDYSRKDRAFTVKEFPELGKFDSPLRVWKHWLNVGQDQAKNRFNEHFQQWKTTKQSHPDAKDMIAAYRRKMVKYGVAALPFLVEKIQQNETELIPLISELTGRQVKETATTEEIVNWWNSSKERWLIPFGQIK